MSERLPSKRSIRSLGRVPDGGHFVEGIGSVQIVRRPVAVHGSDFTIAVVLTRAGARAWRFTPGWADGLREALAAYTSRWAVYRPANRIGMCAMVAESATPVEFKSAVPVDSFG